MADWYVSSTAHAAVPVFAVSTAYTVGQFVRRITSTPKAQWVMRVTTAGTSAASEPTWPTTNNGTVTSGGAVFTNVTGQSAYGWSAAAGDLPTLLGAVGAVRFQAGDRIFVSSDHSETQAAATVYGSGVGTASFTSAQVLSVNRGGSVPPVAADLLAGATVIVTTPGSLSLDSTFPVYFYGMTFTGNSTAATAITFSGSGFKSIYLDGCQLYLNNSSTASRITGVDATLIMNNTTVRFSNASQGFIVGSGAFEIVWLNTASALAGATIPTSLFGIATTTQMPVIVARGVDFSAITGTLVQNNNHGGKYLFDSCRIAGGVTRYGTTSVVNTRDIVELVNCYDGTNIINESYQPAGVVTTERTITLTGGAADDVGTFSHKLVSSANVDKYVNPLAGFWMDIEQQAVGSSRTATVEIISSASLNNDEINLLLEYQGTSGSPVASFVTSLPATMLTAASAVTTSTAAWNSSPATPVKQKLAVTFTPQLAGRVRGQVRLGKSSTTCYYDPVIRIT